MLDAYVQAGDHGAIVYKAKQDNPDEQPKLDPIEGCECGCNDDPRS